MRSDRERRLVAGEHWSWTLEFSDRWITGIACSASHIIVSL